MEWVGWSEARITAWKLRETEPNAYYYRFNEPGEAQKTGAWTAVRPIGRSVCECAGSGWVSSFVVGLAKWFAVCFCF